MLKKAAKAIISNANNSEETQDVFMNVIPAEKQKSRIKG